MKTFQEITHYAGFDWTKAYHQIIIVDSKTNGCSNFFGFYSVSSSYPFSPTCLRKSGFVFNANPFSGSTT
ncbi:MAG: hypothetical protein C5B47_07950 [Verrucomicrobia bacterium]|nr:MAG: hypothetical protein C5B47_07950 [Verrucomicrobiota bacterium]